MQLMNWKMQLMNWWLRQTCRCLQVILNSHAFSAVEIKCNCLWPAAEHLCSPEGFLNHLLKQVRIAQGRSKNGWPAMVVSEFNRSVRRLTLRIAFFSGDIMCQSASKTVVICVGSHSLGNVLVIILRWYHLLWTNLKLFVYTSHA